MFRYSSTSDIVSIGLELASPTKTVGESFIYIFYQVNENDRSWIIFILNHYIRAAPSLIQHRSFIHCKRLTLPEIYPLGWNLQFVPFKSIQRKPSNISDAINKHLLYNDPMFWVHGIGSMRNYEWKSHRLKSIMDLKESLDLKESWYRIHT